MMSWPAPSGVIPWLGNRDRRERTGICLPMMDWDLGEGSYGKYSFDAKGLLKRHDYNTEVSGGSPAAQYVTQHQEFSGILVPTKRRVLGRREDGTSIPDPFIVSIDLSELEFS